MSDLLDRIERAAETHERTSVGDVLQEIGSRSFGPVLLLAGLVLVVPGVGDIPGVSVVMGTVVMVSSVQALMRRDHLWVPGWVLRRKVSRGKVQKGVGWLRPVARVLDRLSKPRLSWMTHGGGYFAIAAACIVIAAATPAMEVVPFSALVAGIAITGYGVALITSDGAIALLASAFSAAAFVLTAWQLVSN